MNYLSLCAIVKDEGVALHEWVRHHLLVGVEHFFLYDNDSRIPVKKILKRYVDRGLATVIDFPGHERQLPAYNDCLKAHGHTSHWMAFLDADEFLFPVRQADLRELLIDYDDFAGLAVNCITFGSSGRLCRPRGLQTRLYRHRFPLDYGENCHVKCVVQPARTAHAQGVHHFHFTPGNHCVNEAGRPVFGPFSPVSVEKVRINHYFYRSQQDFCEKLARGHADFPPGVMKYSMDMFYDQAVQANIPDQEIADRFPLEDLGFAHDSQEDARAPFSQYIRKPAKALKERLQAALLHDSPQEAVPLAKSLVMRDPASSEAWLLLGMAYNRANRPQSCLNALYKSIRLHETIEAFYLIFQLHARQENAPEARRLAAYLRFRLARTPFSRNSADYAAMADALAAYLGKA